MIRYTDESEPEPAPLDTGGGPGRAQWSRADGPSMATIEAVAEATGRDPTDLPPLYSTIDPDALDALLIGGSRRNGGVSVSFEYADVIVTVGRDGDIAVRAAETG